MITPTASDDPEFAGIVSRILDSSVELYRPAGVYVVHIDNWFDVKWRAFSGKVLGAVGIWKRQLTVPPFRPNRVLSQSHFSLVHGDYVATDAAPLHRNQPSSENLNRDIRHLSDSALFFWYSGASLQSGRGSLMLYRIGDGKASSWYASFHRAPVWKLLHTREISRAELLRLAQTSKTMQLRWPLRCLAFT